VPGLKYCVRDSYPLGRRLACSSFVRFLGARPRCKSCAGEPQVRTGGLAI
jgi:hypothetical protein